MDLKCLKNMSCLDTFQQFPCKLCNTTWVSHLSLELHIVEKHEKKMYVCDICGYTSLYLGQVKEHKKAVNQKIKLVLKALHC